MGLSFGPFILGKTLSLREVLDEVGRDPYGMFDQWKLEEVRRACLKALQRDLAGRYNINTPWIRDRLQQLAENGEYGLFDMLLGLYVDRARDYMLVVAIQFAVALAKRYPHLLNRISKPVLGRLYRMESFSDFYQRIPEIRQLLDTCLNALAEGPRYSDREWAAAERAVDIILLAGDTGYADQLCYLAELLRSGTIKPEEAPDDRLGFKNTAVMTAAAKRLRQLKFPQLPLAL